MALCAQTVVERGDELSDLYAGVVQTPSAILLLMTVKEWIEREKYVAIHGQTLRSES
jgi:hypothetical protein